jgi:hypothetical protein
MEIHPFHRSFSDRLADLRAVRKTDFEAELTSIQTAILWLKAAFMGVMAARAASMARSASSAVPICISRPILAAAPVPENIPVKTGASILDRTTGNASW